MEHLAFKRLQAVDRRPSPFVENTGPIDQHICLICYDLSIALDFDIPFPSFAVPDRLHDLAVELDLFIETILGSRVLDVLPNLGTLSIKRAPICAASIYCSNSAITGGPPGFGAKENV